MSSKQSKESGPELLHTRARRRLETLQCCWGYEVLEYRTVDKNKVVWRVAINMMDRRVVWRWQAHGNKSQGGPMMEEE